MHFNFLFVKCVNSVCNFLELMADPLPLLINFQKVTQCPVNLITRVRSQFRLRLLPPRARGSRRFGRLSFIDGRYLGKFLELIFKVHVFYFFLDRLHLLFLFLPMLIYHSFMLLFILIYSFLMIYF